MMPGHLVNMRGRALDLAPGALVRCALCQAAFHPLSDTRMCPGPRPIEDEACDCVTGGEMEDVDWHQEGCPLAKQDGGAA